MTAQIAVAQTAEANDLLSSEPFALLVGMLLDQQIPMERAFTGPYVLAERLGSPDRLDPAAIAQLPEDELVAIAAESPAIHRFPKSMATRIQSLARAVCDDYDGDAGRIWSEAADARDCLKRLRALPGFGEQKAKIFLAVLLKSGRLPQGMADAQQACDPYGDPGTFMSVADVTGPDSLQRVREWKQAQKAAAAK